ncbi:MAG: hypothetical protein ACREAM_23555 [Blastocatellia bacterium]
MAAIAIPESVQAYFPPVIEPSQLWVNYNPHVDDYAYVGFAVDDETKITSVMIEHFSKWLLLPGHAGRGLQPV